MTARDCARVQLEQVASFGCTKDDKNGHRKGGRTKVKWVRNWGASKLLPFATSSEQSLAQAFQQSNPTTTGTAIFRFHRRYHQCQHALALQQPRRFEASSSPAVVPLSKRFYRPKKECVYLVDTSTTANKNNKNNSKDKEKQIIRV